MMSKRNLLLTGVLAVLIAAIAVVQYSGNPGSQTTVDETLFVLKDSAELYRVTLETPRFTNTLQRRQGNVFMLNELYIANEEMTRIMEVVLQMTIVQRPVSKARRKTVNALLDAEATTVTCYNQDGEKMLAFEAGGVEASGEQYYRVAGSQEPFLVNIPAAPGSYLPSLWAQVENDWLPRVLFRTDQPSFLSLKVAYTNPAKDTLKVLPNPPYIKVEGLSAIDTVKLGNYMEEFTYLEADRLIEYGEYPRYDSLLRTPPIARITLTDMGYGTQVMKVFAHVPGDSYQLVQMEDSLLAVFYQNRTQNLLRSPSYFAPGAAED